MTTGGLRPSRGALPGRRAPFALLVAMAALILLSLAQPALAQAVQDRTPASVAVFAGHCGDDGGTCTASDAGTPGDGLYVGVMQSWCGSWWCSETNADIQIDSSAFSITSQISAIRFHAEGRDCTHNTPNICNGFSYPVTFYNWDVPTWSGTVVTLSAGDGGTFSNYGNLCATFAACDPYVSAGGVTRVRHYYPSEGGNEDGSNLDYHVVRAEGDLNHPTGTDCTSTTCTGAWHTANFAPAITCSDAGTSGGASSGCTIEWCLDGDGVPDCTPNVNGASWGSCTAPCGPTITTEDDWYIRWQAVDGAGNRELPSSANPLYLPLLGAPFAWNDGGISNWLVNGPYASGGAVCDRTPLIPTADNYARVPGYVEPSTGVTWTAHNNADPRINFDTEVWPPGGDQRVGYALAYVWSDTSKTVRLWETSDDGIRVYVNGVNVLNDAACQGWGASWEVVGVTLNAGWNTILVQVTDNTGGFELTLDITVGSGAWLDIADRDVAISQSDGGGPGNLYLNVTTEFVGLDKTAPTSTGGWFENPQSNYLYISGTTLYFSALMGTSTIRAGISGSATDPVVTGTPSGLASVTYSSEFGDLPVNNGSLSSWTTGNGANQGYGISNVDTDAGSPATVTISDVAGNQLVLSFAYVRDVTAPSTSCTSVPSQAVCNSNWVNADTTVTLTCSDTQSGCNSTRNPLYCIAAVSGGCTPSTDYTVPIGFNCAANNVCVSYLRYNSSDNVANAEPGPIEVAVRIDKINPFTRGPEGDQGWFNNSQSVGLACVDVTGTVNTTSSLCAAGMPRWCVDTTNTCTPGVNGDSFGTYSGPVSVSCAAGSVCANLYLRYNSSDGAGNSEPIQQARYRIDRQLPTVTVSSPANNSWFRRDFPTSITDSDGSGSGLTPLARGNLSGWWRFNESSGSTTVDSSGNGNTGYFSGPRVTWNASGWMGSAANFSYPPSNNLDNVSISDFGNFNAFTVSAWIYRMGNTGTLESIVSYKNGGDGTSCGFVLRLNDAAGNHYPRIWVNNGTWTYVEQPTTVPVNTWVHLAATYNNSYIRLYRNGSLVASAPAGGSSFPWLSYGAMSQCTQNTSIGNEPKWYPSNNWIFPGVIDDVRIYSSALSPDEIWAMFNITGTYRNDTQCYYTTASSVYGTAYTTTQPYEGRSCPSAGGPNIGVWSPYPGGAGPYAAGHDCQDSGAPAAPGPQNRCRAAFRAIDSAGSETTSWGAWSLDWDGPFVNISSPPSHSWQTADFAVSGPETDYPPGGVASGLPTDCYVRVATIPYSGGTWTLRRWGVYTCGTDPTATVTTAPAQCPDQADNSTWPRHRATCLVVTGAVDQVTGPESARNPSMLYYPLDDNNPPGTVATDLGPGGINGTLAGGASWASDGGYIRHGVSLDGTNDDIEVTLPAGFTGGPLTNFTVEFWARPTLTSDRGLFSLCQTPASSCSGGHDRHIHTNSGNNLCMRVWPHTGGAGATCSATALSTGWNHIALRVQKGVGASLFRNGTDVFGGPIAAADHSEFDWADTVLIGRSNDATNQYFAGTVDEVKVHFRPLNDTEIAWAAQSGVPDRIANDSEPGGARHFRIDYTLPATPTWNSPGAGSEQTNDFTIDISDSDGESGLRVCEYKLQQPTDPNPDVNIIRDWTPRTCNSTTSVLIPVGGGASECQDFNPDPDIGTPCRVYVRSIDNAGLVSVSVPRDFVINYLTPLLRIESARDLKTVGLYRNDSETCTGTVSNCRNWWYDRLRERGYIVADLSWSDLNISNGLRSQGYANDDFTGTQCGPVVTSNINYGDDVGTLIFGGAAACTGDTYSIMWKGYVYIPTTAADWFFGFASDDRARVFIDNTLVINDWVDSACEAAPGVENSPALTLSQGYHAIKVQFAEETGTSCARLYWRSATAVIPSGTVVPSNRLFATKTPAYGAVLNPYGEVFPGTDGPSPNPEAINIRDYASGGNTWLESGGFSLFYPWTGATGGAAHSQTVCADILSNGNQVLNRTRNSSNATAFHNAPSNYQVESAAPDRPSLGMTGACGSAQKFRALYVNQTGARYGPALHCYGAGCVARTDDTTPGRWEAVPWNWSFGAPEAIRLRATTTGVGGGTNSFVYRVFNSTLAYTIVSGDKLEFDVWLDNSSASVGGGFDAVLSTSGPVRTGSGWTDQNGFTIHPANDTWAPGARGRWYHRAFDMSNRAGQTLSTFKVAYDNVGTNAISAGTYDVLLANVAVTDSTGRVKLAIHQEGSVGNGVAEGPTGDVTAYSVSTVAYAGSIPNAYADLLRHWVNQNWTIMLEDDDDSQTPIQCTWQVRSAGSITVSNGTRSCDNDLNFTVGPGLNCRDEGNDQCWVLINTTNDTGGAFKALKFGIDWTKPDTSRDLSESSPCAYRNNSSWVFYSNNTSYCSSGGSFTVSSGATDTVSGVAYVAFPDTSSGGGITIWPGPHDWAYTFGAGSTFSGMATLYVRDNASNVNSTQFTAYRDYTIPSGNTGPVYYNGYNTSLSVNVTLPGVTDGESRLASIALNPPLGRLLMRRGTLLYNGTCNDFGDNWTVVPPGSDAPVPTAGGTYNDQSVVQGTCYQYSYNVSDNVANWANATSPNIARIDITPLDNCGPISIVANNSYGYVSGTTIYYNGNRAGGYNVTVLWASDDQSGVANVTFPTTTSAGGAKLPPPIYEWSYNWTSSSTFNSSTNATCWNNAGFSTNVSFTVLNDRYPPTGNTGPIYTDGFYPEESVTMTLPPVTDNLSGVKSSGAVLLRRDTVLFNGVCNGWGNNWTAIAFDPASPFTDSTVVTGNCYQYGYNVSDNVLNWNNSSSTSIARIDTTPPAGGGYIDQPPGNFPGPPITPINYYTGSDPESGIGNWYIQRSNSSMDCAGAPLGWSAFGNITSGFGQTIGTYPDSLNLIPNTAYKYQLVVENLAGVSRNYTDLNGDISYYRRNVDPNVTKQLDLYEWNATFTGPNPADRWAFHNQTGTSDDGFTVTQTSTSIEVWRNGTTTFSGWPVSAGETHTYKVAHDYACGSGNYTYVYRDGLYVGRVGGPGMARGDVVRHVASINTQVNSFIAAPGRWDPPLNFDGSTTAAAGCTNYVLDSCRISGARPCVYDPLLGGRAVQLAQVLDAFVYRPGAMVNVTASFSCTGTSDFAISYNSGNGSGWFTQNQPNWFRNDQVSCVSLTPQFPNAGNPGMHRVRASIRDGAEGPSPFTCGTWSGDNDDVTFWVAEPVRG